MATYPYTDPRRRQLIPPPPPVSDAQPSFDQPAQPNPLDADNMTPPPITLPQPQPQLDVAGQQPASGLNSVGQALEKARSQPLTQSELAMYEGQPATMSEPTQLPTTSAPTADPGTPPSMRLSPLASKMAQARELNNAPLNAPVTADSYGLPQVGAAKPMTRKHMALSGLLLGALEGAAKTGKWQGALGGAATGAIGGAVKPSLIGGVERENEKKQLQGDIDQELSNRTKVAQLGDINAQTKQRDLEPALKQTQLNEQYRREQDMEAGRNARSQARIVSAHNIATARAQREEQRHKESTTRPQYRTDPTTGDIIEISPGAGGQATSRVLRKGSKEAQSAGVAGSLYDTAGKLYDDSKSGYEATKSRAQDLRDQAEKMSVDAHGDPDYQSQLTNATKIKVLNKQADKADQEAEDLKRKVQGLQAEGDKRRAESQTARPADTSPTVDQRAGTLNLTKVTDPAKKAQLKAKYPNARVIE